MSVRLTPEQFKRLIAKPAAAGKARAPRVQRRREELPENIVVAQITDTLRLRRWTVTRQQSGLFTRTGSSSRIRVNRKGESDWRAERVGTRTNGAGVSLVELFYLEIKAPGRKPSDDQVEVMEERRRAGITAVWFDSLASFEAWYATRYPHEVTRTGR